MIRLVRAEFLKLRTTQVWFWLLVGVIAVSALLIVAQVAPSDGIQGPQDVPDMFASATTADIVVFVLGVLGVTTEFRYQTITPTVLQTPSRWAIVTAKMITYALVGALYAIVALGVQIAVAVPWLDSKGITVDFGDADVRHAMLAVFTVTALHGLIGLGVGALLRNQIVGVVVGLIFLLVLENILLAIPKVKNIYVYTPAGGATSLLHTTGSDYVNGVHLFSAGAGVAVLIGWAFVPAIIGAAISMNRDIT